MPSFTKPCFSLFLDGKTIKDMLKKRSKTKKTVKLTKKSSSTQRKTKNKTHKSKTKNRVVLKKELSKSYEPAQFETQIYQFWEKNGYFAASDTCAKGQDPFSIVIPPPNVTGALHMGHALTNTIQDILVRYHRMKGDNTLWMPGTDHAGIATQAQVEKHLAKTEKNPAGRPLTRHDLGRDEFVKRVWKWKEEYGNQISNQLRRMGSSLDWKRERFTMDEGFSAAVREVFVRLHQEGLIYRGERIINWCPRCQTALSDLEVLPTERKGFFWHITYKVENSDEQLVIATTRPETLLGDTAVAIHPEDQRYQHLHGKNVILPLLGRVIPIITDPYVDREFGSGALKVTPAHDFNDNELGKKHGLSVISVMGKDGKITPAGGTYADLKFAEARERIIQDLKTSGQLIKTEDHTHKIGLCQRCDQVAEPLISKQWFVKIEPLATPAIEAVKNNKIVFVPKSWEKTYFEWMNNIRDWCISRQLWWGHQIPAWYCNQCHEVTVSTTDPKKCSNCQASSKELKQDEDVLDTWFSSALWPFGTLGWPKKTQALETFYPTSILETGFDIIFFWVARMIMMGIHFMGDVPFSKVYLHAMVRDEKGEKMSKSKGNVIDPLDIIQIHGADPLRFTLAIMAGQGRDIKLSVDRVGGYRAFCNKLWNAVKFFHLQLDGKKIKPPQGGVENWIHTHRADLLISSRWIISRLQNVVDRVNRGIENFELNESAQALYEFIWHEFCDWYIELSKLPLREEGAVKTQTVYVLHYVLEKLLVLLHPFTPFVTEELWQSLPWRNRGETLMLQTFPLVDLALKDTDAEHTVHAIRSVIDALRNFRGEHNISPKVELSMVYIPTTSASDVFMRMYSTEIKSLAKLAKIEKSETSRPKMINEAVIPLSTPPIELRINMEGLVDTEVETKRLKKEIDKIANDILFVEEKLSRESFVTKAPPELVEKEKRRKQELISKRVELEAALKRLANPQTL